MPRVTVALALPCAPGTVTGGTSKAGEYLYLRLYFGSQLKVLFADATDVRRRGRE